MTFSIAQAPYSLPPVRRIVTGHTPDGKATIIRDEQLVPSGTAPDVEDSRVTRIWTTKESPADNSEKTAKGGEVFPDRVHVASTNGTHIGTFDLAPGGRVPKHRTSTIDYIILLSGEITATLEDGIECTLSEPGSILVQRGTLHGWENRGSSWARFIGVLVDAKPVCIIVDDEGKTVTLEEGPAHAKEDLNLD